MVWRRVAQSIMFEKALKDFLTLWVTVEPIGTLILFASLTATMNRAQRRSVARKAAMYSAGILLGSIVVGQALLRAMDIQLISFQIAGGLILLLFALQMVFGFSYGASARPEQGHEIAVFPLALPSIAGAEAIMAVVLLTDNQVYPLGTQLVTAVVVVVVLAITYGLMLLAEPILKVIGLNGAAVLERVTGIILAALAIDFILQAVGWPR